MNENILFSAKWITGYSFKHFKSKMGSAKNVLRVRITQNELSLTTNKLFKPFAKLFDIYHIVPVPKLKAVELEGFKIFIQFISEYGEDKKIVLRTRRANKIYSVLDELIKLKNPSQPRS
ncbi:MAG: hypothetical protein ACI857_000694 [Arenicella sp.]|jgi:hypothetical protein